MELVNGATIFVEEEKQLGKVIDAEKNLVEIEGEEITVDPEFCREPTAEELNQAVAEATEELAEATEGVAEMNAEANQP